MLQRADMNEPIGRRLFIGIPGRELDAATVRLLDEVQAGGVVLFARNVDHAAQLIALTGNLHARGIRVAIDQEGGCVNRLRNIVGESPRDGRVIGRWLREFGVDINFAPVLDLDLNDTDNALRERCWGRTADEVVTGAGKFLDDLQAEGVAGCLKHFPGLGRARCDSHEVLPVIGEAITEDLAPFRALLPRARAVMVSHAQYPMLDGARPASLSRRIVTGLLREELGFTGEVFTDDLEMGAITQAMSFEGAVLAAFDAGADRLLVCHTAEKVRAAHRVLMGMRR